MSQLIEGYEAEIYQALWRRPTYLGVPKVWASVWMAVGLGACLVAVTKGGFRWLIVPALIWLVGHGILMALTLWDQQFDDVLIARFARKYRPYYHAG